MADAASQVLLGSGLTVLSQPLMYVKVLVQVRGGGRVGWSVTGRAPGPVPVPAAPPRLPVPAAGGVRAAAAHPGEERFRAPGLPAARSLRLR